MAIDLTHREVEHPHCDACGAGYPVVTIFATQDGDAHAVVGAFCHGHPENRVWLDVTLGSWVEPYADHVTMTCVVTPEGAGLYDSLPQQSEPAHRGQRLTREQALDDPRLAVLWPLVDQVVTPVPEVSQEIYGPEGFRPVE